MFKILWNSFSTSCDDPREPLGPGWLWDEYCINHTDVHDDEEVVGEADTLEEGEALLAELSGDCVTCLLGSEEDYELGVDVYYLAEFGDDGEFWSWVDFSIAPFDPNFEADVGLRYACVRSKNDDDWGTAFSSLEKAIDYCRDHDLGYIAVIDSGCDDETDPVCIKVLRRANDF